MSGQSEILKKLDDPTDSLHHSVKGGVLVNINADDYGLFNLFFHVLSLLMSVLFMLTEKIDYTVIPQSYKPTSFLDFTLLISPADYILKTLITFCIETNCESCRK